MLSFKLKFVQFLATNAVALLLVLNISTTQASMSDNTREQLSESEKMDLRVHKKILHAGTQEYPCAIGKGGLKKDKEEGDGATPVGEFPLRRLWYRQDQIPQQPQINLPVRVINQDDGWCDDVNDPEHYNRPVKLPYNGSHENMWREDNLYDLVIEVGYNDAPPVVGKGSAIFIHIARPGYAPTAGCVALTKEHLLEILPHLSTASKLIVESD